MNIAVIGAGYVGLVCGACLADFGNEVTCVDADVEKISRLSRGIVPIFEAGLEDLVSRNAAAGRLRFSAEPSAAIAACRVVIIAVGTPSAADGQADLRGVEAAARETGKAMDGYRVVVDKSTVPVGTSRLVRLWILEELSARGIAAEFDVVSCPEFLREGTAVRDFLRPDRLVVGTESERALAVVEELYRPLLLAGTPLVRAGAETAELVKYASNAFLALKLAFINEVAGLCEAVGADVRAVADAVGMDRRIGPEFLRAGPGFGGSCLPGNLRSLAEFGRRRGSPMLIAEAVVEANELRKLRMVLRLQEELGGISGKVLAVLGLAFKADTDDLRESPAAAIVEEIARRGGRVRAYDPAVSVWAAPGPAGAVELCDDEYAAMEGSDALVLLTDWERFRGLDLARARTLLRSPLIFDYRNILDDEAARRLGLRCFGVGR